MASVCVYQSRYHPDEVLPSALMGAVAKGLPSDCNEPACPYDHIVVEWWTGTNRDSRTHARLSARQAESHDAR